MTAPSTTKRPHVRAAVIQVIIRVPMAVPNTLAKWLAPSAQPRNRPLIRNRGTEDSIGRAALP